MKIKFFSLISVLLLFFNIAALNPSKKLHQYVHRSWQTVDGLPQNSAHSIAQTDDGYVWIATQEGLARFDGVSFKVFNRAEFSEIGSNDIRSLFKSPDGSLWIGTYGGGAVHYKNGQLKLFNKNNGLSENLIKSVYVDNNNCAWLGTYKNGINIICDGKITNLSIDNGLPDNSIRIISGDGDNIWIGTVKGLVNYHNNRIVRILSVDDGLKNEIISSLHIDSDKTLWIGTKGGTLHSFSNNEMKSFTVPGTKSSDFVNVIFKDKDKNLWVGTENGLHRFNSGFFESFSVEDGLTYNSVRSIIQDVEGNIWVGTSGGGINIFSDGLIKTISSKDGLTSTDILPVLSDSKGSLWAGTSNSGVDVIKTDGTFKNYSENSGLSDNRILSLMEDDGGSIWIGTVSGLNILNPSNGKIKQIPNIKSSVSTLFKEYGVVWAGTHGEFLQKISEKKLTQIINSNQGLNDNVILSFIPDRKGNYYIGTMNGLYLFNGKTAEQVYTGLTSSIVYSILLDDSGDLWVGTDSGLNLIIKEKVYQVKNTNFLFHDSIFSIAQDSSGKIWLSSNKGIYSAESISIKEKIITDQFDFEFKKYTISDGMKNIECNGGFSPAYGIDKKGNLFYPTIDGIAVVSHSNNSASSFSPNILIEYVKSEFISFSQFSVQNLIFPPGSRKFEIKYTAPSFSNPASVKFRYKLEGFDSDFVDAGSRRTAFYTNLGPGDYTFHVVSSNNGVLWNENGAKIRITIKPYFYQTVYFYLLIMGLSVFIITSPIFTYFRKRIKKVEKEKVELEKRAIEAEKRYEKSRIDEELSVTYLHKLFEIMDTQKIYRNPNLTIQILAEKLKISHLYLSQVINLHTSMTFYTLLNMYRILEVMEKLQNNDFKNENVITIAYDAGFNTKSAFNSVFKKFTGLTPTEYRKKYFL